MEFRVNSNCIGCGLCVSLVPEVFAMTDAGTAEVIRQPEDPAPALEAQEQCPASAIENEP